MGAKTVLVVLIIVSIAVMAFFFIYGTNNFACVSTEDCYNVCGDCICINRTCVHKINKSRVEEIINSEYPESRKEIEFDPGCGESGCWKAEIQTNTSGGFEQGVGIVMDPAGNIIEKLIYCDPVYSETHATPNESREIWYYNTECENPQPYCNINKGLCKRCSSNNQCVKKKITIISSGAGLSTEYLYEIKGSSLVAMYEDTNKTCIIKLSGNIIFDSEIPSLDECVQKITSRARCSGGLCGAV